MLLRTIVPVGRVVQALVLFIYEQYRCADPGTAARTFKEVCSCSGRPDSLSSRDLTGPPKEPTWCPAAMRRLARNCPNLPKPTMPTRRSCCDCIRCWALASKSKGMAASRARVRRPVSSDDFCQSAVVQDRSMKGRKAAHLQISYAKTAAACNAFLLREFSTGASDSAGWCGHCMSAVVHYHCTVPESAEPPEEAEALPVGCERP